MSPTRVTISRREAWSRCAACPRIHRMRRHGSEKQEHRDFRQTAQYNRCIDRLVAGKTMKDASFIWWLIRSSTHYPTIELRICDSCTRVEDAVAIASLYRCLVRYAVRCTEFNAGIGPIERAICAENIWQVQCHGIGAMLVNAARGREGLVQRNKRPRTMKVATVRRQQRRCRIFAAQARSFSLS